MGSIAAVAVSAITDMAIATSDNWHSLYECLIQQLNTLDDNLLGQLSQATATGQLPRLESIGVDALYGIPGPTGNQLWEEHYAYTAEYYAFTKEGDGMLILRHPEVSPLMWCVYCLWMEVHFHPKSWVRDWSL